MTWGDIAPVLGWSAVAVLAWAVAGWLLARAVGRYNVVDTLWPIGFMLVAVVAFAVTAGRSDTDGARRGLLLACTLIWGARLAYFIVRRSAGKGEDPRYTELLERRGGNPAVTAIAWIFLPQAVILYVVSATVQVGMAESGGLTWIGILGALIWLVGLSFEAVGDHQMNRFRSDSSNKGTIIDEGLWRWTRHPNYFGDAAIWTGLFVITAAHWPGVLTVVSPAIMTYLLAYGTGKKLLEKSMSRRDGYPEYAERTSGFFPIPRPVYVRIKR